MEGIIKRLNTKGFGFITPDGATSDVFFHMSACPKGDFDQMREGDRVTFETEDSDKGPRATNVVRV